MCLCLGELKLKFTSGGFQCPNFSDKAQPYTGQCLRHFSASSCLVCSFWPSRWCSSLQKLSSVSVFPLSLQFLRWNFRKCQIQPGPSMTDKDAIPTTEECKSCGSPSAEELGESKGASGKLILNLSCCRNHLLCLRQPCCFGSVDKLQLEWVPAWLRQCSHLLQSYQKITSELHVSIDQEEGLLNDDQELNPTKKQRSNFFGMWNCISG